MGNICLKTSLVSRLLLESVSAQSNISDNTKNSDTGGNLYFYLAIGLAVLLVYYTYTRCSKPVKSGGKTKPESKKALSQEEELLQAIDKLPGM